MTHSHLVSAAPAVDKVELEIVMPRKSCRVQTQSGTIRGRPAASPHPSMAAQELAALGRDPLPQAPPAWALDGPPPALCLPRPLPSSLLRPSASSRTSALPPKWPLSWVPITAPIALTSAPPHYSSGFPDTLPRLPLRSPEAHLSSLLLHVFLSPALEAFLSQVPADHHRRNCQFHPPPPVV